MNSLPTLAPLALKDEWILYTSIQDIDIFVEDTTQLEAYKVILERLKVFDDKFRFHRVFALGGKSAVLKQAEDLDRARCRCFIIDGDLDYALSSMNHLEERIFVHDCYCLENYFVCLKAVSRVLYEELGGEDLSTVIEMLNWEALCAEFDEVLVPLFLTYATIKNLTPSLPTVRRGLKKVVCENQGACVLSPTRAQDERRTIEEEALKQVDLSLFLETRKMAEERVRSLPEKYCIVSGKHYLLPIIHRKVKSICKHNLDENAFSFRLAISCDLQRFEKLRIRLMTLRSQQPVA